MSPRAPKCDEKQIVAAAGRIIAESGLQAATIGAIAERVGAPIGSIYYRFDSRGDLIANVWLQAAADFQQSFFARLRGPVPFDAGLDAALLMAARVRSQRGEARILLMHRREDFIDSTCSVAIREKAEALGKQVRDEIGSFAIRLSQKDDKTTKAVISYAVIAAPFAVVRPYVATDEAPPKLADSLIETTYRCAIDLLKRKADPP